MNEREWTKINNLSNGYTKSDKNQNNTIFPT